MIQFQKLTLEDRPRIEAVLTGAGERGCEYSFANLYLWGRQPAAFVGEDLVIFSQFDRKSLYLYPVGSGDRLQTLYAIIDDAAYRGIPCRLTGLTEADCRELESLLPRQFRYHISRDSFDYIYDIHGLADLPGRKYQRKRNHVNRFLQEYPDYSTQPITRENLPQVRQLVESWYEDRLRADPNQDFLLEQAALSKALRDFEALGLEGMVLQAGDRLLAMAIGSRLNETTFDIHFEKAMERSDGVYGMINREFARYLRDLYPQVRWLNREDDMGIEGLRKAKLSYSPDRMIEKSWVCLLEACYDY